MKTTIRKPKASASRLPIPLRSRPSERRHARVKRIFRTSPLKIRSILVPIDFSVPSKKALAYAVPFAEQFGAKLVLLHVVESVPTPDFLNAFPLIMENDKIVAGCKGRLEQIVREQAIDPKLIERTVVRQGRSYSEIADAARTLKADLIIVSTHGYTGVQHALLGSTTERVVRHAPCPVLVVREREREFVAARRNGP